MSADNAIVVFVTKDSHKRECEGVWTNMLPEGILAYRVAHVQAIDNFEWLERNQLYNVGAWMVNTFGDCTPFYTQEEAFKEAERLLSGVEYVEYGIVKIERLQYNFPW